MIEDNQKVDIISLMNNNGITSVKNGQIMNNGLVSSASLPLLNKKIYIKHNELLNQPRDDFY